MPTRHEHHQSAAAPNGDGDGDRNGTTDSPTTQSVITIVSGLPRSGTSMLMRMLEAGGLSPLTDHQRAADADNPNGYYELEAVKHTRHDPSWLNNAGGRCVKIIYRLLRDLPPDRVYRVLFMRRSLDEILRSQQRMLKHRAVESHVDDATMKDLFEQELRACDQWIATQPQFAVLDIDYARMIGDVAGQVSRVNTFLGGTLDSSAMCCVIDPALYRHRIQNTQVSSCSSRA